MPAPTLNGRGLLGHRQRARRRAHALAIAAACVTACCTGFADAGPRRPDAETIVADAAPPVARGARSAPQQPQEPPPTAPGRSGFDETFGARVGGMLVGTFHTEATLDVVGTSTGTSVDFEDQLGLSGQGSSFRVDSWFRFSRRSRLDLAWFTFDRSATRVIDRDINWGGSTFPINATVNSNLSTDILQARYTYYLFADDDYEFGPGIGIYGMNVAASLRSESLGLDEGFKSPVPLPVLSLQGAWEFAPSWQLVGGMQFFFLKLENVGSTDEISGGVTDLTLGVEYELIDHVGLGAAYDYFNVHAGAVRDRLDFNFDYGYSALFAYMTVKL